MRLQLIRADLRLGNGRQAEVATGHRHPFLQDLEHHPAFAIAIIAGLAAPRGILVCGLAYGALEALISGYFYTGIRDILGFSLMILALFLKPEGLFGQRVEERA